jgi:multimeric flavodoxin WrbA
VYEPQKERETLMKIIGVAASPRENKSTRFLLEQCLDAIKSAPEAAGSGVEVELIDLAPLEFQGCIACDACKKGVLCSQQDDFQPIIPKLADPELAGIIMATPVYMGCMTSRAKAFLDRTVVFRRNGFMLKNKLGGVIAVGGSRNGGQELTVQAVHAAMMIHDMIIVGDGDHFGGAAWGNHPDGYEADTTGIATARNLGIRMGEVAATLRG